MGSEIDFEGLLAALSEQTGRDVQVDVGIRYRMDPLEDFVPVRLCGRLGSAEFNEHLGENRFVASFTIGRDRSLVRLDPERFTRAEIHTTAVKADFSGLLIAIAW